MLNFRDDNSEFRLLQSLQNDSIDSKYGFDRVKDATERVGWLLNMHPVLLNFWLNLKLAILSPFLCNSRLKF